MHAPVERDIRDRKPNTALSSDEPGEGGEEQSGGRVATVFGFRPPDAVEAVFSMRPSSSPSLRNQGANIVYAPESDPPKVLSMQVVDCAIRPLRWLWASPWSALGLSVGLLALLTGGGVQCRRGIIEFHGRLIAWLLTHRRRGMAFSAMTLGHIVIGRSVDALDAAREHELVHVRQYERWGPLFVPAYLLCSLVIWLRGGNAYFDNPFEREAYRIAP